MVNKNTVAKKISVVVPVYRSEDCVEALVKSIETCLADFEHEIVLVNDYSPDKSWSKIKQAAQNNKNVIGINFRKNSGQDNAIMAGLAGVSGEYVVIMDDDLQHDPRYIKNMIAEIEKGDHDICFANFLKKRQKWWKNLGSWFNGKMSEIVINKPKDIYLSPFKVIRREVVNEIIKYKGPYPYIDGLLFTVTQNVTQIPVEHQKRFRGKGNYDLIRSVRVWLKLMTSFSVFPLRIATVIGIFASLLGFTLAFIFIVRYFFVHEKVEGWTSLMVIILILCGTILLALGCVGEYIGRAYIQLNQRPQYSIKEIVKDRIVN